MADEPTLEQQLASLRAEIASERATREGLVKMNTALTNALETRGVSQVEPQEPASQGSSFWRQFTEANSDLVEGQDPDQVRLLRNVAETVAESAASETAALRKEVADLKGFINAKAQDEQTRDQRDLHQRQRTMWRNLHERIPEFEQINHDPAFHKYIAETVNPTSMQGETLDRTLVMARDNAREDVMYHIFDQFRQQSGGGAASEGGQMPTYGGPPLAVPEPTAVQPVGAEAMQGVRGTGAPTPNVNPDAGPGNGKMVWTPAAMQRLSSDIHKGKFAGREKERDALIADLDRAAAEGRVVMGS